jgi:hypothetical protein
MNEFSPTFVESFLQAKNMVFPDWIEWKKYNSEQTIFFEILFGCRTFAVKSNS